MDTQTQTITTLSPLQEWVLADTECTLHQAPHLVSIDRVLHRFAPISLNQMTDVALLRRTDTKYVLPESQLPQLLVHLSLDYYILQINDLREHRYQTLYFDTPGFDLYHQHHNGSGNRFKVHIRTYRDSHATFLEIKQKTNKGVTVKSRLQSTAMMDFDAPAAVFLYNHSPYQAEELEPKLWNTYSRITLVSKHTPERLTLDLGLSFQWGYSSVALPGVVIAEVKREGYSLRSDFIAQMRTLGIRPMSFSKYCIGIASLYDGVKTNAFKPKLRYVNKLMQERILSC